MNYPNTAEKKPLIRFIDNNSRCYPRTLEQAFGPYHRGLAPHCTDRQRKYAAYMAGAICFIGAGLLAAANAKAAWFASLIGIGAIGLAVAALISLSIATINLICNYLALFCHK